MILCTKCRERKPESDFYSSTIRAKGTGVCKACTVARVKANRATKIDYYREFDKQRANLPHRIQARNEYAQTERGRERLQASKNAYYKRHPKRSVARNAVNNAIRDKKLEKPSICECCKESCSPHAHHCDYNKPLDVMWLCDPCHKRWHRQHKPIY